MSPVRQRLTDHPTAAQAISDLCAGLVDLDVVHANWQAVEPEAMPQPFRRLLVHRDHMTTTLRSHHGQPVELRVLADRLDGDVYRRKIVLTLAGTQRIVEFGIVRIDLTFAPPAVREGILERRTPLGDVLIGNGVMRRIVPHWYLRFPSPCALLEEAGISADADSFGRVGTIYCNHEPAIELLEIVVL